MPNNINSDLLQSRFTETFDLAFDYFFLPINMTLIFSLVILSTGKLPQFSEVLRPYCEEYCVPSNIRIVLSANCISQDS